MLTVLLAAGVAAGQNSLFQQQQLQTAPSIIAEGGPAPTASLINTQPPKPQTYAQHDLVTIVIRELASNSTKGDAQASRDSKIDGKIDAWTSLYLSKPYLRPTDFSAGKPELKAELSREFDGSGSASRTDSLIARIQAEIIEVKPNGNLVIQASKRVVTDEEAYTLTLTGTCRTKDITPDNTVLSTQISELEVVKTSDGSVSSATKRGLIHKFLDWVNVL
jgi:flagellar L-ring protein precursor FlgH